MKALENEDVALRAEMTAVKEQQKITFAYLDKIKQDMVTLIFEEGWREAGRENVGHENYSESCQSNSVGSRRHVVVHVQGSGTGSSEGLPLQQVEPPKMTFG